MQADRVRPESLVAAFEGPAQRRMSRTLDEWRTRVVLGAQRLTDVAALLDMQSARVREAQHQWDRARQAERQSARR